MNQLFVQDKGTKQEYEIVSSSPRITDGTDGKKTMELQIEAGFIDPISFEALVGRNLLIVDEKVHKRQKYVIRNFSKTQDGDVLSKSVSATHIYAFLLSKNRVDEVIQGELTLEKAFAHALKGSKFTFKIMDDAKDIKPVKNEGFGDAFSIELIDTIISNYKIELDVNNYEIYIYKKIGKKINKTLDTRANINGLTVTISEDNTATRGRGFGKQKEEKDTISESAMGYESKTGTWSYDDALKADFTNKPGATFTFSFTGTGFRFVTLTSKLGGKWEFKIDDDKTKTISVYKDQSPKKETIEIIRGLEHKKHKVIATFKGKDSKNPNTKGKKTAAPIMYLLRDNVIETYREYKNENEKYVFEPVLFVHPNEQDFLIDGQPTWAEPIKDDAVTKAEDMNTLLEEKVNPFPEVTVAIDFEEFEVEELKGLEDELNKGDTLHVIADTPEHGITFEDDVRAVSMTYNPLDLTEKPDVTFTNVQKDMFDLQLEDRRRIRNQERYIKEQKNSLLAQIQAAKNELSDLIEKGKTGSPQNAGFSLVFKGGSWGSSAGDVYIDGSDLIFETPENYEMVYATVDGSALLKQNGITPSIDYEDNQTDTFIISFFQSGKKIKPDQVPDTSKISVGIVGYS
ncbi:MULTISPECIES: phage tail spike protein [Bacillus]|uniref:phage tail spike protein n=1 Tax=Bacillus TaxID=1386 RepID=UPI000D0480B8|nr:MULTISPECIES: phage tail spike protein [Bacillus]PRS28799.1 autolysin [Bacillus pumilus]PRS56134.1 autolysin [Bacillus sp. MZGC1]PRS63482.1 autolysin [Bacillus pumilus]PRS68387.1 autolysin [Bacillus pumilus]